MLAVTVPLPGVCCVQNFLTPTQCQQIIQLGESTGFTEADIAYTKGARQQKDIRNNWRVKFTDNTLAKELFGTSQIFLPEYLGDLGLHSLNNLFRIYKYEPGQYFKSHRDGIYKDNDLNESRYTWMVYLNEDYQGGATRFKEVSILPQQGMLLVFPHQLLHEAMPVTTGEKYVLRSDVMYRKLETDDAKTTPLVWMNDMFAEMVVDIFSGILLGKGYIKPEIKISAWQSEITFRNTTGSRLLFSYSGFPDVPPSYQITLSKNAEMITLQEMLARQHPEYIVNQDQFLMVEQLEWQPLTDEQIQQKLYRHWWEIDLLLDSYDF